MFHAQGMEKAVKVLVAALKTANCEHDKAVPLVSLFSSAEVK